MNNNLKNHWENIYQNKNEDEVSWFQKTPNTSIEIINSNNDFEFKFIIQFYNLTKNFEFNR